MPDCPQRCLKHLFRIFGSGPHFDLVSPACKDLLALILRPNPAERPTAAQCLLHPWISPPANGGLAPPSPLNNVHAVASLKEFLRAWRSRFTRV